MKKRNSSAKNKAWGVRRVRLALRSLLERYPGIGDPILKTYRNAKWRVRQAELARRADEARGDGIEDVTHVAVVPTSAIEYLSGTEFSFHHTMGAVVDGDWDLSRDRFADLDVYEAISHVLAEGGAWAETAWYRGVAERIGKGETPWGCRSVADLDARCEEIAAIYGAIQRDGYRSQAQLLEAGVIAEARDEIALGLGRTGELFFTDGAHRLCCAKVLGVREVPIQIAVRHPEWMRFRAKVIAQVDAAGGELYQVPMHPDLETLPHSHGCEDRFALIEAALQTRSGRVLDIGSNWGYFCHRFEALGFDCVAVEQDPAIVYFMTTIRDAMRRRFEITSESILGTPSIVAQPYDVVLALNIFHHFIKTRERFEQLETLLGALECRELFIEPHAANEPQMADAYRPFTGEQLVQFVSERCNLPQIRLLGTMSDDRKVYQLTR